MNEIPLLSMCNLRTMKLTEPKIIHGGKKVDREKLFSLSHNSRTSDHPMKLNAEDPGRTEEITSLHSA